MARRRTFIIAFAGVICLMMGAVVLYTRAQQPLVDLGVGYAAKVACGCRYIGNRPLEACYHDFEEGMEIIRLSEDAENRTITASVPLLAKRSARFDPLLGCQPNPFER